MPGKFQGDDTVVAEVETPEEVQTEGQLTHFTDTNLKKLLEYLHTLQASVNDGIEINENVEKLLTRAEELETCVAELVSETEKQNEKIAQLEDSLTGTQSGNKKL
ncbi:MAG: hypothetical protein M1812_008341 [Candelaria pacifica]|nr:MAG: hypothetical protein M1812_008341 [Candelaria pacifica]